MKLKLLALLLFTASFAKAAIDTTAYTILFGDKVAGKHLVWSSEPDHYNFFFEFNDRGRGPRLNATAVLDENGFITKYEVTGYDYYKAPVQENYDIKDGNAIWKNKIENEQRPFDNASVYSPINGTPAEIQLTLKLLEKSPRHELGVLPSGKISAVHIKNHKDAVNGVPVELELWSFTGSGGPPSYVWFTPKKAFFASVDGWVSIIEKGYESLADELKAVQDVIEQDYFLQQAQQFTKKPSVLAFKDVTVFDAVHGKNMANHTVVVENGKITEVGKADKVKIPQGATVIEGKGKTLLPGLWDNHAHYASSQGLYHLAGGVTNIKDMGNSLDLPDTKKKVDNDQLLGPEISVMSGFVDFAGPYAGPTGKIVKTLEEGLQGIDYYADHGYQQIKLYSSIPVDWVKPLAAEAHKRGLKVCGHIPSFMTASRAVDDGYDQLIHINMIMLNFMGDTLDTRSMGRFIKVAERGKNIDVKSEAVKQFLQKLKDKHIVVDPTVTVFEGMFTDIPGKPSKSYEAIMKVFPAEFRRGFYNGGLPGIKDNEATYQASFDNMLRMVKALHDKGVTIVPGTDGFPGFTLHRELESYAHAGIPNAAVLQSATITSAKVANVDKELGSIEVGKKANLVLVEGDPLKNISDVRKVELTVKNGRLYDSKALYQSYGFGYWK